MFKLFKSKKVRELETQLAECQEFSRELVKENSDIWSILKAVAFQTDLSELDVTYNTSYRIDNMDLQVHKHTNNRSDSVICTLEFTGSVKDKNYGGRL